MSCHICNYWTPEKGCAHYGPSIVHCERATAALVYIVGISPVQRIEAYKYAFERVHIFDRPYICLLLRDWSYPLKLYLGRDITRYFPEFAKHKPAVLPFKTNNAWWPEEDADIRRQVLQQCIEQCLLLIKS